MEKLQQEWKHLYADVLPGMAREKNPKQKSWPVHVDHCFGRIVLDNAVGKDKPWMEVVKSPAVKNMTEEQIKAAIKMGEDIASGDADLGELNQRSLDLRGKNGPSRKAKTSKSSSTKTQTDTNVKDEPSDQRQSPNKSTKRKTVETASPQSKKVKRSESGNISTYFLPSPQSPRKTGKEDSDVKDDKAIQAAKEATQVDMEVQLKRIADSQITPFRKQTLSMLCQVPRGRYSTYQAMSDFITANSHKTCARAVGNAMRNNPFAPEVPCHRILAADGSLGGFAGHWGEEASLQSRSTICCMKRECASTLKARSKAHRFEISSL